MRVLLASFLAIRASGNRLESPKLTLDDFHSILTTESLTQFSADDQLSNEEDWSLTAAHEWGRAETLYRRSLESRYDDDDEGEESMAPSTAKVPFVVCDSTPNLSGYERRSFIEGHFGDDTTHPIYNRNDMSCYSLHADHPTAVDAPSHLIVHPFSPSMKLPHNAVDNIFVDVVNRAKSLQLDLCKTHATTKEARLEVSRLMEAGVKEFLGQDIVHEIHSHTHERLFRNILDDMTQSERSSCLSAVTEHFSFRAAEDLDFVYIDGVDKSSPSCAVAITAYLSTKNEVCALSPVSASVLMNQEAQWIVQSGTNNQRPFWNVGIKGNGQVIQVSDTGLDQDNCYFYDSSGKVRTTTYTNYYLDTQYTDSSKRKVVQYNAFHRASQPNGAPDDRDDDGGHGTHVVGSIVGSKTNNGNSDTPGYADGVAKEAKVAFYDVGITGGGLSTPTDVSSIFNPGRVSAGASFHSASWGSIDLVSGYTQQDANFDAYSHANDEFLILAAAGNDGWHYNCVSPSGQKADSSQPDLGCNDVGSQGIYLNEDVVYVNNAPGTTGSPSNAKNVLSVGATESANGDLQNGMRGIEYIADFSSRGPTGDNRRKPDLLAPGSAILSANSIFAQSQECDPGSKPTGGYGTSAGLTFMAGTSMATPVLSGTAALVRQYFLEGYYPTGSKVGGNAMTPKASLVKAVLINSGQKLSGAHNKDGSVTSTAMYDNNESFGRVNLLKTLRLNGENSISTLAVDRTLNGGQSETFSFTINNSGCQANDLSVTLVWMDPAVSAGCTNCVVNDMDLKIQRQGGSTYYPNGLSGRDDVNNVERVRIDNPSNGGVYVATVTATQITTPNQKFSVVASGCFSDSSDEVGTEQPSAAPSAVPSRAPSRAPSDAPTMIPGNTASPTRVPPSAFPSLAPSSSPTAELLPDSFCEVTISFQNLKIVDDEDVGADQWNDEHTELFQKSVHALNTTFIPDHEWICFVTPSVAFDKVSEPDPPSGIGERLLRSAGKIPLLGRLLQEVKYVGIHVDFTVTAPFVKNSDTCNNDNAEFLRFANDFYNDISNKLGDGTLQGHLRSHGDSGSSSWLSGVTVSKENLLVVVDTQDDNKPFFVEAGNSIEDRHCSHWERKQWIKENYELIITVGAAFLAVCCLCGLLIAKGRRGRSGRGPKRAGAGVGKKYKANVEMHGRRSSASHNARSPFHKSPPKGVKGGSSAAGIAGYHGTKTNNPSSSSRAAARVPPKKPPKGGFGGKRGSTTRSGGYY